VGVVAHLDVAAAHSGHSTDSTDPPRSAPCSTGSPRSSIRGFAPTAGRRATEGQPQAGQRNEPTHGPSYDLREALVYDRWSIWKACTNLARL
jgi:hypothetical protein